MPISLVGHTSQTLTAISAMKTLIVCLISSMIACCSALRLGRLPKSYVFATFPGKLSTPRTTSSGLRLHESRKPNFIAESESKYFEFQRMEKDIYQWWEHSGYFKPKDDATAKPFVIPMPPPNVTGYLHMGHAIFIALQDIMARFYRMQGYSSLWLPGT